jgi:hypothetical protein
MPIVQLSFIVRIADNSVLGLKWSLIRLIA